MPIPGAIDHALGLIAEGKLAVRVGLVYPLAEAPAAHRESESGRSEGRIIPPWRDHVIAARMPRITSRVTATVTNSSIRGTWRSRSAAGVAGSSQVSMVASPMWPICAITFEKSPGR